MNNIRVIRLSRDQAVQLFPLARLAAPNLSLDEWRSFARVHTPRHKASHRGVLAAQDDFGTLLGYLVYRAELDLQQGRILVIKHFYAQDLLVARRCAIALALLDEADAQARALGCGAIHTLVPTDRSRRGDPWVASLLAKQGHAVDQIRLRKAV